MEYLQYFKDFDGKALIIMLLIWATVFNIWRAQHYKRLYWECETAFTQLAQENVKLCNMVRDHRDVREGDHW